MSFNSRSMALVDRLRRMLEILSRSETVSDNAIKGTVFFLEFERQRMSYQSPLTNGELRVVFLSCVQEFHQFLDVPEGFSALMRARRMQISEIAGLTAASYLNDMGGLLGSW